MEKYEPPEMEVIAFDTEDVIMTSGEGWTPDNPIPGPNGNSVFYRTV